MPHAQSDAYSMIDRYLRNNLGDDDYAEFSAALDAVAAPIPQQPSVPEGWKLVPIEPTSEMLERAMWAYSSVVRSLSPFTADRAAYNAMLAAAPQPKEPAEPVQGEPDMFWNNDDADRPYSSIGEFLNHEICFGNPLEVGSTRTIQRAIRLPNIEIRITAVNDEECEADYEVIAAAPQPKDMK